MSKLLNKITTDSFDEAVSFIATTWASVKRKELIHKIVRPIGCALFTFLSFILVFGATYKYSSPEDMPVFATMAHLRKFWEWFSNLFTTPDMVWYVYWLILIASVFVIPLAVSAVIAIIVSVCHKPDYIPSIEGTTAEKAKKLHKWAVEISDKSFNYYYEGTGIKRFFKWIFVLAIAAFLGYAFVILNMQQTMLNVQTLIGFVIVMVVLYFVFGWILSGFYALNKLFYKKPLTAYLKEMTEDYWLSVDTEESNRRLQERKPKKEYKPETNTSQTTKPIDKYDSFTWTYGYVRDNETQCSDVALSILKVSKELLEEGDYSGAAAGFDKVVRALELLQFIDEAYYQPPLFANCYALSRIFAFGLNNRDKACEYAQKACEYAAKCAAYGRPDSDRASRDLNTMQYFLDELKSSRSFSGIVDEYGDEFPYDIINMN